MASSSRARSTGRERFVVTGPGEEDHPVPSVGAGLSCAQTFATRQRKRPDEVTFYVRDALGILCAMITKREDGVIATTVVT